MSNSVIQLKCSCNNYPWGKQGKKSLAARLCQQTNPEFKLEDDKDYAEMWMGTYPELPSYDLKSGKDLQEILNDKKDEFIGKAVLDKFGADLPFLPKILSIAKALPLQIHPNKDLATKLHKKDPEKFTDPNHKPEIAVALGRFEVFVGFKPYSDIQKLFELDPLRQFMTETSTGSFNNETLRELCKALLTASESTVASVQDALAQIPKEKYGDSTYILDLLPRLQQQYSKKDNGTLVALLVMNYLVLEAGEALFVPADGIHAYLSGDIVECMARSNNVLNTGFCPRADRDSVEMFCEVLTFEQRGPEKPLLERVESEKSETGKTTAFKPPMSEFNMLVTELKSGEKETVKAVNGPSIMIITSGKAKMRADGQDFVADEGYIYFIGRGEDVSLEASCDFAAYRAYAE